MKTLSTVIKLPVLEMLNGKVLSNVKDIVMNPDTKEAVLVLEESTFADLHVLRKEDTEGIGNDYIVVKTSTSVKSTQEDAELAAKLGGYYSIIGLTVISSAGNIMGKITDFTIDESAWTVAEVEIEGGEHFDIGKVVSVSEKYMFVQDAQAKEAAVDNEPAEEKDESAYLIGMTLKEDVTDEDGTYMIEKGTVLTAEHVEEAKRLGFLAELVMNAE